MVTAGQLEFGGKINEAIATGRRRMSSLTKACLTVKPIRPNGDLDFGSHPIYVRFCKLRICRLELSQTWQKSFGGPGGAVIRPIWKID